METQAQSADPAAIDGDQMQPSGEGAIPAPDDLAAQLSEAQARAERYRNDYIYAQAEIENIKKRAWRQSDERLTAGRKSILARFLGVLDNLQRALAYDDSEALRNGLQATLKGFEGLLASEQVTPLEVVGKPFDPRFAEAIAARDTGPSDDGVVLEEAQRGYVLGDEVLRPALVVVGKSSDALHETGE